MPPRQPTKNRINMHDIVAQPLTALPDAVDAVLKRPEVLDEVEVAGVFRECSYILLRAEEALSMKDGEAFCALFKLLSEGLAHSEASFEGGIQTFALHEPLLHTVHTLFRVVVEQGALPIHSPGTVELIQVVSSLCDGEAIKDTCGSLFIHSLASFLVRVHQDEVESQRHFHVQRGVATALINLVKGSKQNKQRLSSWKFVADCCAVSVDVFFQLQCIELLFRVSRQRKTALAQLGDALPAEVIEQLRSLPNDGTLLTRMTSLIEDLNTGRPNVLKYPLTQVVAADTVLTEMTDAYFTPHYFIVMVTSSNADNVTIPYRIIRSVTLGKDGRVIVKLEEFPVKLEVLLSHTAGMDTVTLHMTVERLSHFKQSSIRTWIVEALTARREAARAAAARGKLPAGMKRGSDSDDAPANNEEEGEGEQRRHAAKPGLSAGAKAATVATATTAADDALRKKQRTEPLRVGSGAAVEAAPVAVLRAMIDAIGDRSTAKETHAIYTQLKRLIDAKTELHKEQAVAALNGVMADVQTKVDTARRTAEESRSAWRGAVSAEVGRLDAHIADTQGTATAAVEKLNDDLRTIKQSNLALNERIACIEVELQRTLEESREREAAQMRELRDHFNREIEVREHDLDLQLLNRANAAVALSHYLRTSAARGALAL